MSLETVRGIGPEPSYRAGEFDLQGRAVESEKARQMMLGGEIGAQATWRANKYHLAVLGTQIAKAGFNDGG